MLRDYVRRLLRLAAGIAVSSLGIVLMLQANVGLEPWSVLQQGMTLVLPVSYGLASVIAGAAAIGLAVLFGESFGVGTIVNIIGCGVCIDAMLALDWVPQLHSLPGGIAMLLAGLELLALLLLGHIPAVGALYRSLGLDIFADVPFFAGFTLRSALLLCYVGIFCAAIGFLLTAKITEYTSATEASFVYLIKPVLATLLAVVCFRETISVNRMIGLVFFLAASLCVSLPVLREMRRDAVTAQPPR